MNIMQPQAKYLDPTGLTPYQFIERVGRTCYKSEDKISEGTDVKFVKMLAERKHGAMLEHAFLYYADFVLKMLNAFPKRITRFVNATDDWEFASVSFRTMMELIENLKDYMKEKSERTNLEHKSYKEFTERILPPLRDLYPELFGPANWKDADHPIWPLSRQEYVKAVKEITMYRPTTHEFDENATREYMANVFRLTLPHTILFTVDRGVTHELVRMRIASYGQESTRYCNYEKGKYGSQISVIAPHWSDDPEKAEKLIGLYEDACTYAETKYMQMIKAGATPQDARAVLPQTTKADIVMTAVEYEWQHVINLRLHGTTGAPHPDMKKVMAIATPLLTEASEGRLA